SGAHVKLKKGYAETGADGGYAQKTVREQGRLTCPCGFPESYENCCGRFHVGMAKATTAEALMRSRYSAFVKGEIDYLKQTTWPVSQKHFDEAGYRDRAENSIWLGLAIHETTAGSADDKQGTVTFSAKSMVNGQIQEQGERSLFKKKNGQWYYVKPIG
ncbi:MAG: YchJ family metal-binding protein, partial [Pseudomonadota bacterium]